MQVRKAVITAAAPRQNRLPLQQLVDSSGEDKTALQLIVDETAAAGIEEICLVIRPEDQQAYELAAGPHLAAIQFVHQPEPLGYADAIHRAADFVANDAFLHLVGDHLYVSSTGVPCAKQLVDVAKEYKCSVSAVQSTRESMLPYFGVVSGPRLPQSQQPKSQRLYEIEHVIEKPTPTLAEQELVTPGLRSGHYLGFFGMHVLTADVMSLISDLTRGDLASGDLASTSNGNKPCLSDAVAALPSRGRYLAHQIEGTRYNLGVKYGLLKAQLAIGLSGRDRDEILVGIMDLLSNRVEGQNVECTA
ncbi:UTP--glucose-1-phosphate uridylyltransferase [Rubripirellula obstinata]|uniref:UTP--glucose-1-phosphate uridylyltransferase n=1 Tax=Rubripirellula obstinata TaxID=406547 RepID=A0A5B1CMZ7_9BACT|nr:sugar phosphate nucleotidyltransferase [Rubripirellula obstinata]KAA1261671.1 UTP--glucose-1-phosphate uridylyltransferase [Rubripirellula obstinata]